MKHLLTVLEIFHWRENNCIWQAKNIKNQFHKSGEEFILSSLFRSASGIVIPSFYYIGLDARIVPTIDDTISGISGEPLQFGYSRQPVSSVSGFTISLVGGVHRATSSIVSFSASGGSWGPVTNVFLTDRNDNTGYLIATSALGSSRTLNSGDLLTLRFGLSLQDG